MTPPNSVWAAVSGDGRTQSDAGASAVTPPQPAADSATSAPGEAAPQSPVEATITMMIAHAKTAEGQSGEEVMSVRKGKEIRFAADADFRTHIAELLERQQGRCAITQLPLQLLGDHEDEQLLASLDRIDSNGHYEALNLQLVCRFVNRWKRDDPDDKFRELMGLLRNHWRAS
jgi:hypothetical protein